jgi:hypothetical protein
VSAHLLYFADHAARAIQLRCLSPHVFIEIPMETIVKTSFKFFLYLAIVLVFAGCSGHPRRGISVAITGAPATVAPSQVINLGASVSGDKSNAGVTWTLSGAGTDTSTTTSLAYTAPATVPANPTVSVTATSITDPTKSATVTFTIATPAIAVTITNPITSVIAGQATNPVLDATVANDIGNAGVSWTLVTAGTTTDCQPGCGTIVNSTTTNVQYMPPATVPANPSTSLIATSIADPTKSDTDTFTIQAQGASALSFLSGPYAFEMSGFDAGGDPLTLAGSITADGMGGIIAGEIDVNDNFAVTKTTTPVTGTYTLTSALRGVITLNQPLSAFSNTPTFAFTIDSATNTGNIMGLDSQEQAVSGVLDSQSASVMMATPSGNFIFRGASDALDTRFGEVGRFTIGAGGAINNGLIDSADIDSGNDSVDTSLDGSFLISDASGRGAASLDAGSNSSSYAYYAVSPTKLFLIEINSNSSTQVVAVARGQNLSSLTASSVNGTGVFGLIGGDDEGTPGQQFASVAIGQLVISGGNTASISCDINDDGDAGQCTSDGDNGVAPIPGTVAFDPTTGRGTITLTNGFNDGFLNSMVFYLESTGTGVLLDTTGNADPGSPGSFPEALVGDLTPQISTTAISGTIQGIALTSEPVLPVAISGALISGGVLSGLADAAAADEDPVQDVAFTGSVSAVDSTGRANVQLMDNDNIFFGEAQAVAFAINPTTFYVIGETADPNNVPFAFDSTLGVFTSQTLPNLGEASPTKATAPNSQRKLTAKVHSGHHRRAKALAAPHSVQPAK